MAIKITNTTFTDIYGNTTNQLKANAGDKIIVNHTVEAEISFITTSESPLRIDKLENKITRSNGSFLDDGFRTGARYVLYIINNNNNIHEAWTGTIISVTDKIAILDSLPDRNNWSSSSDYICVFKTNQFYPLSEYQSLEFALNFVDNESPNPSLDSIIDGETSRFSVSRIDLLNVNQSKPLVQAGKKSGQFTIINPFIQRNPNVSNPYSAFNSVRRCYNIGYTIIMPSMFAEQSFIGSNCLKLYSKTSFKVIDEETLAPATVEYNQNANTGLWNEGFNSDEANSKSSTTISQLYYNVTNTFSFNITCATSLNLTAFELGAMYLTEDDSYNLNKDEAQDYYLPLLKTGLINSSNITDQYTSTSKQFMIVLNNVTYVDSGGLRTFTIEVSLAPFYTDPNKFGKFVESRGDLERRFLFWCKLGNTNRLIFDGQIEFKVPVGVPLVPEKTLLVNHNNIQNYLDTNVVLGNSNSDYNIEDDILFVSDFDIKSEDEQESITAKVVVKNTTDDFEFTLDKVSFDLVNQDLQFFINQNSILNNNLPLSNKNVAYLIQKNPFSSGSLDVRLIYPININWRYWDEVFSTHPYFVSQNKNNNNWYNYRSLPWKVYVKIEHRRNGVLDYYYQELIFKNYDEWAGNSNIQLFDSTETNEFSVLKENQTMLIKATHTFPSNYNQTPWGMITIEPKESSPRYIISTEVDRSQPENPLVGVTNQKRCDIQQLNPTTIILRCYVNTNLLSGSEFCISSKISDEGVSNPNPDDNKITENNIDKITEDGTNTKIIE